MGSTKTKTKTASTTTPTVTEPYKTAFNDYTGMVGDFLDMDPTQFVAPPSDLQMDAFSGAGDLGGWQDYLNQATSYANSYASQPITQISATGYQAPTVPGANLYGGTQLGQASTFGGAQLADPAQVQAAQLGAAPLGTAAQLGSAIGYQAPQIGSVAGPTATGAQQTNIGAAPQINLTGYNAPQLGDAAQVDPSRLMDFMGDYQNPYTQQVIDATLADYDEYAGVQRAAQDAQAGLTGAFGGSRYGIMEGQLEGELARGRASTQAALLDQQYRLAAQLAGQDQSAQMQAGLANQDAQNQYGLAQFGAGIDQARYGADAANQGTLANRDSAMQFAMAQFGVDASQAAQFADALNTASLAGYQGDLQTALTQAGFDAESARYFADVANQFNLTQGGMDQQAMLANQAMLGQYGLTQGSMDQQANLANQDSINNFLMQQGLLDQQTGTLNMEAMNQFALQQGLLDQQTGQYNTDALNNFLMTQVGLDADAARYYADALNQASFANADLTEQAYLRELQAAGMLGDMSQLYGTQSLADLGMTADLGTLQRSLEAEYLNAYPTQLQLAGNLYSQLSPTLYSGGTMTGTSTSKTGGTGTWLPQLAGSAMQAIAFSDRRMKTNIKLVRRDPDGLGWYDWNWKAAPDGPTVHGVIADEVKKLRPQAYVENYRNGFDGVNYALLEAPNV